MRMQPGPKVFDLVGNLVVELPKHLFLFGEVLRLRKPGFDRLLSSHKPLAFAPGGVFCECAQGFHYPLYFETHIVALDLADAGIGTGAYGSWPPRGCRPLKKAPAMWPGPSGTSITPIIRHRDAPDIVAREAAVNALAISARSDAFRRWRPITPNRGSGSFLHKPPSPDRGLIVVLALNLTLIGVALTIEAEARWGAEALAAFRLEIYGSIHDDEGLIKAFAQATCWPRHAPALSEGLDVIISRNVGRTGAATATTKFCPHPRHEPQHSMTLTPCRRTSDGPRSPRACVVPSS